MERLKTKSLSEIEERMENFEPGSLRYQILEKVKNFKTSWIELGQALYSVWKDKLFKGWEYLTFEAYTAKEIGIRKETALKLLRSYYFLEKEEPQYLQKSFHTSSDISSIPSYESVNLLRLAKNKKELDAGDYAHLKKDILEKGKDVREVRKDLTALIRQREELSPEEAREKRKSSTLKRFCAVLNSLKNEVEREKLLPAALIKEAAALLKKIEAEIA
jgi:hypothetical protein